MSLKVGHQAPTRPRQLIAMETAVPDSPGLNARLDVIKSGGDPTANSSPIGTGLLKMKMARDQKARPESQFTLPESAAPHSAAPAEESDSAAPDSAAPAKQ